MKKTLPLSLALSFSGFSLAAHASYTEVPPQIALPQVRLDDLKPLSAKNGWGKVQVGASTEGGTLTVDGKECLTGLGLHAPAELTYVRRAEWKRFVAHIGLNENARANAVTSVVCKVISENAAGKKTELAASPLLRFGGVEHFPVDVRLPDDCAKVHLVVEDGGDGNRCDHVTVGNAGFVTAAYTPYTMPPQSAQPDETPGTPPDGPAKVEWDASNGDVRLTYNGGVIFEGKVKGGAVQPVNTVGAGRGLEQRLVFRGKGLSLSACAHGSEQTLAAETRGGEAQKKFPMVRTSHGMSDNLRNNAVYDRKWDWELAADAGASRITPAKEVADGRDFAFTVTGDTLALVFHPHFYQKHKGITYFEPWTYKVREESVTGWSSWWAFTRNCSQKDCDALLAVWKEKRMADFGYRFIQLDDCYQNELGRGQDRPRYPGTNHDYPSRGPATWLDWRKDHYPAGIDGYAAACKNAGCEPGVWVGAHITDNETIIRHPDWFIRAPDGKPFVAPWISCAVDATNAQAVDALVRPTFAGIRKGGIPYVKIDLLRHYLYDNLHHNAAYCKEQGVTPAQMFRTYLGAARAELGRDTFILSCWGVLPEGVGLVDACRIAGDGYGPVSMQQYNAWNGIVWRNDPDICDVYPQFKGVDAGNVTKFEKTEVIDGDTIIRPALASLSGSMLMLGDKPDVYKDDRNIEGARRSSPVLFSVPGQLYNFDEKKADALVRTPRETIMAGTNVAPGDADQFGAVCPWWLNEFNLAGVGQWSVLHRVNWDKPAPATTVAFADIGLESDADYLVYEFWTGTFLGVKRGQLDLPAAKGHELRSYSLRKLENHPQIASTNRHLSQGGADLLEVKWADGALSGRSKVVIGDRYELALHVPAGFKLKSAEINGKPAQIKGEGELLRASFTPEATGETAWRVTFDRQAQPPGFQGVSS